MKIAIYYHSKRKNTSGTSILINNAIELARLGNKVDIYTPSKLNIAYQKDLDIVNYYPPNFFQKVNANSGWGLIDIIFRIFKLFLIRYDVVFCYAGHRPSSLFPALVAKYIFRTKIMEEWWEWFGKGGLSEGKKNLSGKIIGLYDQLTELPAKKAYDGVICISSALKNRILSHKNSIILHGAINSKELKKLELKDARKKLGLNADDFIVGMINVDSGDHQDNLPLLNALEFIIAQYAHARIFITGEKNYIQTIIRKKFKAINLITPGWLSYDDYSTYLNACNVFVLPFPPTNRNIGRWPNKISDFIFVGRTIISNPTGDIKTILSTYTNAILCNNNEDEYKQKLKNVIENKLEYLPSNQSSQLYSFQERAKILSDFFLNTTSKRKRA